MTPNQVTLVSAAFTFASITAIALAGPTWALGVLVWAGLVVGFAFDSADGQLARLTGRGGPDGEWLDHVVDCAKMVLVHTAVLISSTAPTPTASVNSAVRRGCCCRSASSSSPS